MNRRAYHNSIPIQDQSQLQLFEDKAQNQQQIVLAVFERNPGKCFTPMEVHRELCRIGYNYPLTSVRARITNLTEDRDELGEGELIKHGDKQKVESYGSPNNTWQYNWRKNRQNQF